MTMNTINIETTVGEIVRAVPARSRILKTSALITVAAARNRWPKCARPRAWIR
jgi:hypothetical protein